MERLFPYKSITLFNVQDTIKEIIAYIFFYTFIDVLIVVILKITITVERFSVYVHDNAITMFIFIIL